MHHLGPSGTLRPPAQVAGQALFEWDLADVATLKDNGTLLFLDGTDRYLKLARDPETRLYRNYIVSVSLFVCFMTRVFMQGGSFLKGCHGPWVQACGECSGRGCAR